MADKRISDLNRTTSINDDDLMLIQQSTDAKSILASVIKSWCEAAAAAVKKGDKGDTGATGNGIASIAKTSSSGLVDTYTITFTDGSTTTFNVTNGSGAVSSVNGETGDVNLVIANPNLLDNWYFGAPVNQRAVSGTISETGYFLDRWKLTSGSVTVNDGSITLNGTIVQPMEQSYSNVIASALTDSGIITPTYSATDKTFTITGSGITLYAAKLEIGDIQTLARQVSGNWVLNEIPNYTDQLLRCQRFYIEFGHGSTWAHLAGAAFAESAGALEVHFPTPVPMRAEPSIIFHGYVRAIPGNSYTDSAEVIRFSASGVNISFNLSGLASQSIVVLQQDEDGYFALSAEL